MTTHFRPANTSVQEMKPWELEAKPEKLKLSNPNARYAIIIVMGGDGNLGNQVLPDLIEMETGIIGGDEISVVALADLGGEAGTAIIEVTADGRRVLRAMSSIDTGDPRPIASFLTLALNSYSKETKIALGFWGHGAGVFGDLDPKENLLPEELLEMPLGTKLTEAMFLEHYLSEPVPIKGYINKGMLPDESTGGILTNRELSSALTVAFSKIGRTEPVDLLFFDTCQNGAVEVYAEMKRYCKVFIASCLSIPGLGWNYTWFLQMTRRYLPDNADTWGRLAISAYDKAYDQTLFPQPVQLVALNSGSTILEKFRRVAEELKKLPPEDHERLLMASTALHPIVNNESVDVCMMAMMLSRTSGREELQKAAEEFFAAYQEAIVGISAPPNDGKPYSGLTIWCPRLGDKVSVGKYYQHLRFHKETGWFDTVRQLWGDKKVPRRKEVVFCSLVKPELVEEREVKETLIQPPGFGESHIAIHIPEEFQLWAGGLKEGIYRFEGSASMSFSSLEAGESFVKLLCSIRRKEPEFTPFEMALKHDLVLDCKFARRVRFELLKYEGIILDEFPDAIEAYAALRKLADRAADDGILLMGTSEAE